MSQADNPQSSTTLEHDAFIYKRFNERLTSIPENEKGYRVCTDTKLTRAIDKLGDSPFASFVLDTWHGCNFAIAVKGEKAGGWMKPDVSVFQENGKKLKANDLKFEYPYEQVIDKIECQLESVMFAGKRLNTKLYKLAICGEGEEAHFAWRRDSHSDAHRATMLFALNTEWEGGELVVQHRGIEVSVDLHPTTTRLSKNLGPVVVAFYKDMEYKFMPVTKGMQLVLQYDIEVIEEYPRFSPLDCREPLEILSERGQFLESVTTYPSKPDDTSIQEIANEIQRLHKRGTHTVGFPLCYLYRNQNVERESLKGNDSVLFDALKDRFDISVGPVLLYYINKGEDRARGCIAYRYSAAPKPKEETLDPKGEDESEDESGPVEEGSDDDDDDDDDEHTYGTDTGDVIKGVSFHLPQLAAIDQISEQRLIEAWKWGQSGETRFFGTGMFVKQKDERVV
ncbi:hypothetical protein K503DRAFT_767145 [Rhizopogon vinicolor AM-OR11-026]|uniref:Fe2OG dioxygenase domain-containing protein n=1 Tax=Rhizopogon vinicolor AM-OR11-026 TaxID=1314800 RepID=A0A1B7NB30_9AGAM|nr:hypothetical protein K503DRAFT_767145 [Rhizopogon vinicolor AM-OR11-026]